MDNRLLSTSKTFLVEVKEKDTKKAVFDAFVRSSSPASEPYPTPKLHASKHSDNLPSSTDASSEYSNSLPAFDRSGGFSSLPAPSHPARREERPHLLPMCPLRSPSFSSIRVLKLTNLPWSITVDGLVEWLGTKAESVLIPTHIQIVSVHILCDRYFSFFRFIICH